MTRILLLLGVWALLAIPARAEQEPGWESLFDGASMAAWRNYGKQDIDEDWIIEDGAMVMLGGGGDLITRENYADFELELEWWVEEGGNSGIFFLADESSLPIYVHAPEIQILDNARHRDRHQPDRRSGSLYDLIAAPAASQKPAQSWNTVRIRFAGGHLESWQNGVKTVDIRLGSPRWQHLLSQSKFADWKGFGENREGHIGLQDHGDRVAFRNLRIRRL